MKGKNKIFLILILVFFIFTLKVDALIPVTYKCCYDYSYNNGTLIDGFENISNWTSIAGTQEADAVNFKEGKQGLKLIATDGHDAAADLTINKSFSDLNNLAIWIYVDNASNFKFLSVVLSSTGSNLNSFFYDSIAPVRTGWNKLVFNRHNFENDFNESWDNNMKLIRFRIGANPGMSVNVTLDDLRYNLTGQRAKLMIEFDDGRIGVYSRAYPIMSANNQLGVSFVVPNFVETRDPNYYMNLSALKTLQSSGWDISSHTENHTNLAAVNDSVQMYELNTSYDWLVANNFQKTAGYIAYPYGAINQSVLYNTEKRYILGRSVEHESAQQHFASDPSIWYIQRETGIENTTTVQFIEDHINDTINSKLLGIVLFHGIVDSNTDLYDILTTDFKEVSDYVKSRSDDIDVITDSDMVIPIINKFTPVLNKTTRIYSNGSVELITKNKYDEYMPNMTVRPLSDTIDINITTYDESSGLIRFNESSSNANLQVSYEIGDRIPNQAYSVKIYWANGTKYQDFNVVSNNTGYISYNSAGFGNARYQEINTNAPSIISWGNNKTNDNTLSLIINTNESVKFNATANQNIDTWKWFIDDVNQNNNFDNFTTSFTTTGIHTIKVNATNQNGTSNTVTWTVTVQVPPSGPVAYWKFDENTGTTTSDSSGNGNNGTISGGATWTIGKIGNALSYNGVNGYVDAGNNTILQITGAISLEGWIKINNLSVNSGLFGRGHGLGSNGNFGYFLTYYAPTNALYFDTYNTTTRNALVKTNATIDTNWHHIAATWDGTTSTNGKKLYIDGVLVAQKTSSIDSMGNPSYNFRIGIDSINNYPANAVIDEVKVYNRALSASEVLADYNAGSSGIIPPTISSWSNNKTNNNTLSLTININESVQFNATANQTITTWNWYQDSMNQNNNYNNFTTSWNTSGTKTIQVNATNSNGTSNTIIWNITVQLAQPATYSPPSPTNITSTTGNFWVNTTWQPGAGNVTDSYNVSVNGIWTNGTTSTYVNSSLSAHAWQNVTVYAYNASGTGSLSASPATKNTQIPNNPPVQSPIGNKIVNEGQWLNFTVNATDADNDLITYGTNATKGSFNATTGNFSWLTMYSDAGVYVWYFNSSDSYGGVASETITVTVNNTPLSVTSFSPPSDPTTTQGTAQTFNIALNRTANVTWYMNGSIMQTDSSAASASYTNSTAGTGIWNVTAIATDGIDTASMQWNWTVSPQPVYAPSITSWSNSKTNNNSLTLAINTSEAVNFNATANQTITTWNWYKDGVNQINNFDNFTTSFATTGIHTIRVNATNQNGTSGTITWTITVQVPAGGPVGYWKFDENTGTTASDSSGYGNNGTIFGGATWVPGKIGSALNFNGVNGYVDAGNNTSLQITGAISLEGWVKINNLSVTSGLFGRGHGLGSNGNFGYFLTYYAPTNALYFDTYNTTTRNALVKSNAINDTNWHHIAATWDGTTSTNGKKLYIDGVLVAQKTSSIASIGIPSYNFRVGIDSINNYPANAVIDEVKIYNRALSASEVLADYNLDPFGIIPPTISSWSNNKTNDASLNITANVSEIIRFNATANQSIDTWKWSVNDVDQNNNFDNLNYQFASAGTYTIKVNATNQNGTSNAVTWTITVQTPAGIAGAPNITSWSNNKTNDNTLSLTINTNESIKFNATANQTITTWNWYQDDVNQINNFDNFTASFATAGIHTIKVNATNKNGTSNAITWTITVQVPVGAAGTPNITSWSNNKTNDASLNIMANVSEITQFNATANQSIDTWDWFKDDVNQNNNFDNFTTSFATTGIHTIRVNATNQNGTSGTITWTVEVNEINPVPNAPAIISWGNNKTNNDSLTLTINTSEAVNFNVTANQTITMWNWYKDDINQNNNYDNFSTSWDTSGTKEVKVNATNPNGTSSTVTWTVTVQEPIGAAGEPNITSRSNNKTNSDTLSLIISTSEPVQFNATANQTITTWNWYQDDVNQINNFDNFTTSFATAGIHTIKVNATNLNGTSSTVTWTITVQEPTGIAGEPNITSWGNNKTNDATLNIMANVSETIRFNATANQSIDTWKWFVNNVDQNNNFDNLNYQFASAGTYTINVNATNQNGTSNTVTWTITVQAPASGPVAYWKFDENTGTNTSDSSGNGNNGTISGATWVAGKIGNALSFDGVNDYVDAGNNTSLQITGSISLEGWIKINNLSVNSGLFGRGHGLGSNNNYGYFITYYAPTNALYFDTYNTTKKDSLSKTNAIIDNNWHHIAATWDGTTSANRKKLYIDGVLIAQKTSSIASIGIPSYNFRIGIDSKDIYPANATIDEIKVYNRALSASEVLADYNAGNI